MFIYRVAILFVLIFLPSCTALRDAIVPPDFVRAQYYKGSLCSDEDGHDAMVKVGNLCVDKYEASVWTSRLAGTQLGTAGTQYTCSPNGADCFGKIFARSVSGVAAASSITWFQANIACASSGKRLLTSAEWQQAAIGTLDNSTQCNIDGAEPRNTGIGACVSASGVHDMIGNVEEWVADWMQSNTRNDGGDTAPNGYGNDSILGIDEAAPESFRLPAALIRGGSWRDNAGAGVYALNALNSPVRTRTWIGFRCAK